MRVEHATQANQLLLKRLARTDVLQRDHFWLCSLQHELEEVVVGLLHRLVYIHQTPLAHSRSTDVQLPHTMQRQGRQILVWIDAQRGG